MGSYGKLENNFFSETTLFSKLYKNDHWMVPYKVYISWMVLQEIYIFGGPQQSFFVDQK